jgi:hypothetical protein
VTITFFKDDLTVKLFVPVLPEVQNSLKITADQVYEMPLQHGTRLSAVMTDISNNRLSLCLLHELTHACNTHSFYGGKWKNQAGLCARAVLDLSNKNRSF